MSWMEITLVGSVLISWLAVAIALMCLVRVRRQADITQKLYQRLNRELAVANNGSVGMGQRLMAMEKKLQQSKNSTADQLDAGFEPYTQAAQLLGTGFSVDDVMQRCGLSRAEATLMQMMHSQMRPQAGGLTRRSSV